MEESLAEAVRFGNLGEARRLLAKGANPDAWDKQEGDCVLVVAIKNDDEELVDLLLEYEADVNAPDDNLRTPIFEAILTGNLSILKSVLKAGAMVNIKNDRNETPLQVANMANWPEGIELLYQYGAKE